MRGIEGRRRGSPLLGWLIILLSFGLAGYFWFQGLGSSQKERIALLESASSKLKSETVPIKFMVLSREGGQIKARIKLYDLAGGEVAVIEKSWPGKELYIDMLLEPVRTARESKEPDSWIAFPYRIFTDELSAASGSLLFDAYDGGGFPEVLGGAEWSPAERLAISTAFADARRKAASGLPAADASQGVFGSAAHEISGISSFEVGIVYKVVCRVKGGIEIAEDR
jgi:hypothetical protein